MSTQFYTEHFGFRERPFTLLPDPDFVFWSKAHSRAFAVLEYGLISRAPLTVVTGEVGTGKTMLIQALLQHADDTITLGLISNAQGDRGDLLRWVLNALDVPAPPAMDYVSLFQHFLDFVLSEYAAGRYVVLVIDEAQNLGAEMLEELRMLTNINSGKDELLQIILTGQPELRQLITRPELRQFAQRVTATYHLEPFDLPTTRAYIRHRLTHVGGNGDEITPSAMRHIFEETGGIPRMINKLCDLALVYAASGDQNKVGLPTIRELFRDGLVLKPAEPPLILTDRIDVHKKAAE
ncbi:ExeA family protein [uncultured Roseobacter sp.]|uniref:ExeA family protein n=1 Tax=uncultured Roseobacter sp. TaxID=114847 RepID=UPI0026360F92|nr:AAA family ATPase [uncultured Roseobacter sp.]